MKALVLCAGYATRLYPLTLNQPKHLLLVAGKPLLDHVMDKILSVEDIDEIYIVTNDKFYSVFISWKNKLNSLKKISIFNDGTLSDETKLGAIGDIDFVLRKTGMKDDLIVLAGDNLFELDLRHFVSFGQKKGLTVAVHDVGDKELIKKYSEVELDTEGRIVYFQEKPSQPRTTLAAICLYFFPQEKLYLVEQYLYAKNNPDQPGLYIQWLHKREDVYAYVFTEKWYDIGDMAQYKQADEYYKNILK